MNASAGGCLGRLRAVRGSTVLCAAICILFVAAPSALAAKKYVPTGEIPAAGSTPSTFDQLLAQSVAVSNKNGHIYVADTGRGEIFDFSSAADLTPARWKGLTTPTGSFGGNHLSVVVDNTTGDVYVADVPHAVIDKFDENGNLIASFGDTSPSPNGQLSGADTPAGSFSPPIESYSSFPIAINQANHHLYVADPGHKVIDVFDETGAYLSQITATPEGLYGSGGSRTTGIAVNGTNGNVYLADWDAHKIYQFDSAGNYVSSWDGGALPNGAASQTPEGDFGGNGSPLEVGVEDSSGKVFVNNWAHSAVDIFDANGNFAPPNPTHAELEGNWISNSEGVAIDQASGEMYLSSDSTGRVQVFKPVIIPDIGVNPASELTAKGAKLSGHVDPAGGGEITGCHFEYISNSDFSHNGSEGGSPWKTANQAPCETNPSSTLPYSAPTDVSATLAGLAPGTGYHFRLVVSNANGDNKATGPVFATVGSYAFSSDLGSAGSGDGKFEEPQDVAVENATGDIYVADTGNHRIVKLDSAGNFLAAWGWGVSDGNSASQVCTSGCQAGISGTEPGQFATPRFVEVDNSNGPSAGDVYVADTSDSVVQKFDPSGNLITSWGPGGAIDFSKGGTIGGITVGIVGDLFVVTDNAPYNWTEVGQDGVSRSTTATADFFGLGTPAGTGIEVDSIGGFYEPQPGGGVRYVNPQAYFGYESGHGANSGNAGLAVDRSTNDLYVDEGTYIEQFATAPGCPCGPADIFGIGNLTSASGLAFNPATRALYAADPGANDIAVFARNPTPAVTTGPVISPDPTSGTLTGQVDPPGAEEVTDCHFEYLGGAFANEVQTLAIPGVAGGTFTLTFKGETTEPIPYTSGGSFGGYSVEHALQGLSTIGPGNVTAVRQEGQPYTVEFVGALANTNVPQLTADSSQLTPSGATVTPATKTEGNGWASATASPCSPATPLANPAQVSAEIGGLVPFTTYRYRLSAEGPNELASYGQERSFTPTRGGVPVVDATSSSGVSQSGATLDALINPNLAPTVYRFQYGTDTTYGSPTLGSESIGEDNADHSVSAAISGLQPGTTYHFRVLAVNPNGNTAGPDQTFSTPGAIGGAGSTTTQSAVTAKPPAVKPTPATHCKAGFVKKRGRCVKSHLRKRRHHHKRSANHG